MANSFYRLPKVLTHKAEKVNKLVKKTEENAACYKHFFNTSMCTDFFFLSTIIHLTASIKIISRPSYVYTCYVVYKLNANTTPLVQNPGEYTYPAM